MICRPLDDVNGRVWCATARVPFVALVVEGPTDLMVGEASQARG